MKKILILIFICLFLFVGCIFLIDYYLKNDNLKLFEQSNEIETPSEYKKFLLKFDRNFYGFLPFLHYRKGSTRLSFHIYKLTKEQVKTREAIEKQNEILERIVKSLEKKK